MGGEPAVLDVNPPPPDQYYKCEVCRDAGCAKTVAYSSGTLDCRKCPCYYCPRCLASLDVHDPTKFRQECMPIPKECGWDAKPLGTAMPPFKNPLYQMIGDPWADGGAGLYYVASFIKQVALLFSPGIRPPLEPDYFQPKAAYQTALNDPYPFTVPGSTPNNLAPPI